MSGFELLNFQIRIGDDHCLNKILSKIVKIRYIDKDEKQDTPMNLDFSSIIQVDPNFENYCAESDHSRFHKIT